MSTTTSRRDHLTATSNDAKIELTEVQLSRATGGAYDAFLKYDIWKVALKIA